MKVLLTGAAAHSYSPLDCSATRQALEAVR